MVANAGAGLEKRQCSVQLAFSPEDDNLRVAVIFWGTRKKISEDEIYSYHKSVDVYWQQNAWADTTVCLNWEKKLLPHLWKTSKTLFCFVAI